MWITAALARGESVPFSIERVQLDEPRADEVLVRVAAAGICHTDVVLRAAWPEERLPVVLGHEGAGVVEVVGEEVTGISVGDRVLMSYRSCGICPQCAAGHRPYCRSLRALNFAGSRPDGSTTMHRAGVPVYGSFFGQSSFASHAITYPSNLVKVGEEVDLGTAAPLGCGIQTGAGAVFNVLQPDPESSLAILGCGAVGLAAVMAARVLGVSTTIAVEPIEPRRRLAAELGASHVIDPVGAADTSEEIRALTGGGVTHALDTTGAPEVINGALDALAPRGTLAVLGLGAREVPIRVLDLIRGGKTLRGVTEGDATPQEFLPRLLALRANGSLPIERLITTYALEEIDLAIADASAGSTIKPVLVP